MDTFLRSSQKIMDSNKYVLCFGDFDELFKLRFLTTFIAVTLVFAVITDLQL